MRRLVRLMTLSWLALGGAPGACGDDPTAGAGDTAADAGDDVDVDEDTPAPDVVGGCETSADCRAQEGFAGTICAEGLCVACEQTPQCAGDPAYGDLYVCLDGGCGLQTISCLSTHGCNAEEGFEGTLCVEGSCVPCDSTEGCAADAVYAGENTGCVDGRCDPCPEGRIGCACVAEDGCSEGFCVESVCEACPDGYLGCACRSDGGCDAGVCIADACVDCVVGDVGCACDAQGMCAPGGRCDGAGALCETCPAGQLGCPCDPSGGCGDGLECVAELCALDTCDPGEAGCPCASGGVCGEGLGCGMDGTCAPCDADAAGCPCSLMEGCSSGLVCDAADERCRAGLVCDDLDCGDGRLCDAGGVGVDAACLAACEDGYAWNGATASCDLVIVANCGSAPGTIAADCQGQQRACVAVAAPEPPVLLRLDFDGDIADEGPNAVALTPEGPLGFVEDRGGVADAAGSFVDDADRVYATDFAAGDGDALSVAAWVRVDAPANGLLIGFSDGGGGWSLHVTPSGSFRWRGAIDTTTVFDVTVGASAYTPVVGSWVHVAATWSRDDEARIYVGGRLVAWVPATDVALPATGGLTLGRWFSGSPFTGAMDDLRVYAGVLTEAEIGGLADRVDAYCGSCLEGRVLEGGDCRLPVSCATLGAECATQHRSCVPATADPPGDATCGPCIPPREEQGGSCQISPRADCGDPDLLRVEAEAVQHSTGGSGCSGQCWNVWTNGWAYDHVYVPTGGDVTMRARVRGGQAGPNPIDAGFRVDGVDVHTFSFDEPSGTWHLEAQTLALTAGWHDVGVSFRNAYQQPGADQNLFVDWFELEGAGMNPWSTRQVCDDEGRECVDTAITVPTCADCQAGYAPNPALGDACDALRSCADLGCAALGRSCSGEPFAACGDCGDGLTAVDANDPLSACVEHLTCDELICPTGEFCVPSDTAGVDATCEASPCGDGKAQTPGGQCVTCNNLCGVDSGGNLGETGRVWPYTLTDGTCICENEPGWYTPSSGAGLPVRCDVDGDGWISNDAALSLNDGDAARRDNARCALRSVDRVTLQNEVGQRLEVLLCGAAPPVAAHLGSCPSGSPTPVELYEDVELDDATKRQADDPAFPTYAAGEIGRALAPAELNPLTKACVTDRGDFDHNGLVDVSEAAGMTLPGGVTLSPFEAAMLPFTTFLELHRTWYEARPGHAHGTVVIAERSRCDLGVGSFPLGYAEASQSSGWRQCGRNRRAGYDAASGAAGYDLARWTCPATSGRCPALPPPTVASPTAAPPPSGQCDVAATCGAACAFDPRPIPEDLLGDRWSTSGGATKDASNGWIDLGPASGQNHGAIYNGVDPVRMANARVAFDFQTDSNGGGIALTFYDAAHGPPTDLVEGAIGTGAGLGYQQPPGTVKALTIEIDVWDGHPGDPITGAAVGDGDHFAITLDGDSEAHGDRWSDATPYTDGAWHRMDVQVWGTWVEVAVDGQRVLAHRVPALGFDQGYVALSSAFAGTVAAQVRRVRALDVDQGVWRGMNHHSQFRCVQAKATASGLTAWQLPLSALYDAPSGKSGAYQFNACGAGATEPSAAGGANPAAPALSCVRGLPDDGQVGFVARRYDDGATPEGYDGGCVDAWQTWPELCPGYLADPRGGGQGTIGDGVPNDFGALVCGCGVDYGGLDCELGCAGAAYGDSDGGALVGVTYAISPRSGYWMCGALTSGAMSGYGAGAPVFSGSGDEGGWVLDGRLRVAPRERTPLCQDPAHCDHGWRLR